jgi:rhodanese-related sulfurtransferase
MQKSINKQQVEQIQEANAVVRLIDIRPAEEYEKQHVNGAINIPTEQLINELGTFGKDDTIVCICTYGKERSYKAAEILIKAGFENTFYLDGGIAAWCNNDSSAAQQENEHNR